MGTTEDRLKSMEEQLALLQNFASSQMEATRSIYNMIDLLKEEVDKLKGKPPQRPDQTH